MVGVMGMEQKRGGHRRIYVSEFLTNSSSLGPVFQNKISRSPPIYLHCSRLMKWPVINISNE